MFKLCALFSGLVRNWKSYSLRVPQDPSRSEERQNIRELARPATVKHESICGGVQSHGGTPNHQNFDHDLKYWNPGFWGSHILGKHGSCKVIKCHQTCCLNAFFCLDSKLGIMLKVATRTLCSDPAPNTVMESVASHSSVGVPRRSGEWWDHVVCRYRILFKYLQSYLPIIPNPSPWWKKIGAPLHRSFRKVEGPDFL